MIDGLSHIVSRITEDHKKLISDIEEIMSKTQDLDTKEKLGEALKLIRSDAGYVMDTLSRFQMEKNPPKPEQE
jgi:CHASE3 domain sensor protein